MRIALTGTPGTGKTTVAAILPFKVVDINSLVRAGLNVGIDPLRGCLEADMEALAKHLRKEMESQRENGGVVILEGHFSHRFADWAIVLRLGPAVLRERLAARGYSEEKINENLEAEALDVILVEAVESCSRVDEIDTTNRSAVEVADLVKRIIDGELMLPPGQVDWLVDFFG
jgi:adenylate kinase